MDSIENRGIESLSTSREDDPLSISDAPPFPSEGVASLPEEKKSVYKTKTVQFLGRTTPIVLQNDNGPCPLLAICNVLLLRNNLNLSPDVAEVSQERLLSLVAERLIDSNCNLKDKDAGYIENQQQNVADAIDLLPRLATGIDVNIKFRRIDDFEFTRECAIFDLLDIPLYHGWIVDPQDHESSSAIGSKSYNALTGELVALDSKHVEAISAPNKEDDSVDFAAATTATLGVPSPSLLKIKSFEEDPCSTSTQTSGNMENDSDLLNALKITEPESISDSVQTSGSSPNIPEIYSWHSTKDTSNDSKAPKTNGNGNQSNVFDLGEHLDLSEVNKNMIELLETEGVAPSTEAMFFSSSAGEKSLVDNNSNDASSTSLANHAASPRSVGEQSTEDLSLSVDGSEPFYEGEECILESASSVQLEEEPMYEGENILAEQADGYGSSTSPITHHQGELIRNFLNKHANQLTFYGLFCLQEGLKEREICVFFRNNHFNTMFKFDGHLYLLATDQGYINQPNLVWEKLTEVNGDTLFMTSNFKEFKIEVNANEPWDEQNLFNNTADYLASIENASNVDMGMNFDLQLAIALQQQEFEQRSPRSPSPPSSASAAAAAATVDGSRLITGPQRPSSSGRTSKTESKAKDKCTLM